MSDTDITRLIALGPLGGFESTLKANPLLLPAGCEIQFFAILFLDRFDEYRPAENFLRGLFITKFCPALKTNISLGDSTQPGATAGLLMGENDRFKLCSVIMKSRWEGNEAMTSELNLEVSVDDMKVKDGPRQWNSDTEGIREALAYLSNLAIKNGLRSSPEYS
jgi:hypothetical protein